MKLTINQLLVTVLLLGNLNVMGGTSPSYRITEVPSPPSKFATKQIDGMGFLPDGRLVVCVPSGEIFFYDLAEKKWHLFAEGLHNPLGLVVISNSELVVSQRPELTRVRDTDGDGKADDFEALSDAFGMSGNYHEFHFTPVRDEAGAFYFSLGTGSSGNGIRAIVRGKFDPRGRPGRMHSSTPYRGCVLKVTPDGKTTPWAYGLRTPNGLGMDLEGNLFVTDNQGDWVGSSKLFHVKKNRFYGHAASLTWKQGFTGAPLEKAPTELAKLRTRAAIVFPHGTMANSPTKVLAITPEAKFGPFTGQLLVGEMNQPRIMRVMLEKVGGELQGACVPFIDGAPLLRGCNRMAWAPDGSLYVGHTKHTWAGSEGIQHVAWNGETPFEGKNMELMKNGFRFRFTEPVDKSIASRKETWPFKRYYFEYTSKYGSPRHDEVPVAIESIDISPDGRVVDLYLSELKAWHIHEVNIQELKSAGGVPLANSYFVYTLNRLLENTPPEPLQASLQKPGSSKPSKSAKKLTKPVPVKDVRGTVHEAEDAKRRGPAMVSQHAGFSGLGYLDIGNGEQEIEWTVKSETAREREILIRYALGSAARPLQLLVNGESGQELPFPNTGGWSTWSDLSAKVSLKAGSNTVTLKTLGKSGGNIDHLQVVEP
jgi:glucose/arabinose dehydrogenase